MLATTAHLVPRIIAEPRSGIINGDGGITHPETDSVSARFYISMRFYREIRCLQNTIACNRVHFSLSTKIFIFNTKCFRRWDAPKGPPRNREHCIRGMRSTKATASGMRGTLNTWCAFTVLSSSSDKVHARLIACVCIGNKRSTPRLLARHPEGVAGGGGLREVVYSFPTSQGGGVQ